MAIKDISFLICSKRDYNQYGRLAVEFIQRSVPFNTEILYYSKHKPQNQKVNWVQETVESSVYGYNLLSHLAKFDTMQVITDTTINIHNFSRLIENFEKIENEVKITGPSDNNFSGCPIWRYGYLCGNQVRFPLFNKGFIKTYGVLFNESFIHHCCDCWLGAWHSLSSKPIYEDCQSVISTVHHQAFCENDDRDILIYDKLIKLYHKDMPYSEKIIL